MRAWRTWHAERERRPHGRRLDRTTPGWQVAVSIAIPQPENSTGYEPLFTNPPAQSATAPDRQAVEQLSAGAVIVYPTDSSYALGCQLGDKAAAERIRHIRQTDRHHNFTLVCRDLSEIATYAKVDNQPLPPAQGRHAGAVYLHPASDPRSPAPLAAPPPQNHRHPGAG
jgi:hypothetical protein